MAGRCGRWERWPGMTRRQRAGAGPQRFLREALPVVERFGSPRAWAFALLGLDAYCAAMPADDFAADMRTRLADRLLLLLKRVETPEWIWFEENLAYDNARFCEALISVGSATGTSTYITAGLRSLGWLTGRQKSPTGLFRPVGTESFHDVRAAGTSFDQQPIEAAATIAACLAAQRLTEDPRWTSEAHCAFALVLRRQRPVAACRRYRDWKLSRRTPP